MSAGDGLGAARVNAALVGTRFAGKVRHFGSVGSTNSLLLEEAAAGAAEGSVIVADEQTAGRGRGGHGWHSAAGDGLYVSLLARPKVPLQEALLLSLATGLAAWQAVHEVCGVEVDVRWPNDLMVVGRDETTRKCGGILVETAVEPGPGSLLRYAVIGIGINVGHREFPEELGRIATSLAIESELPVSREALLISLLRAMDLELKAFEPGEGEREALLARFAERSSWVRGKRVHVPEQGGYTGVTAGLDAQGFLRVMGDDGVMRTVLSGGVREID